MKNTVLLLSGVTLAVVLATCRAHLICCRHTCDPCQVDADCCSGNCTGGQCMGRELRLPGGLDRLPGGLDRLPGGLDRLPGGLDRLPGDLSRLLGSLPGTAQQQLALLESIVASLLAQPSFRLMLQDLPRFHAPIDPRDILPRLNDSLGNMVGELNLTGLLPSSFGKLNMTGLLPSGLLPLNQGKLNLTGLLPSELLPLDQGKLNLTGLLPSGLLPLNQGKLNLSGLVPSGGLSVEGKVSGGVELGGPVERLRGLVRSGLGAVKRGVLLPGRLASHLWDRLRQPPVYLPSVNLTAAANVSFGARTPA